VHLIPLVKFGDLSISEYFFKYILFSIKKPALKIALAFLFKTDLVLA